MEFCGIPLCQLGECALRYHIHLQSGSYGLPRPSADVESRPENPVAKPGGYLGRVSVPYTRYVRRSVYPL